MSNALSRLTNTNINHFINNFVSHSKFNVFFIYFIILVEISLKFPKKIIKSYVSNNQCTTLLRKLFINEKLDIIKTLVVLIIRIPFPSDTNLYFQPYFYDTSIELFYSITIKLQHRKNYQHKIYVGNFLWRKSLSILKIFRNCLLKLVNPRSLKAALLFFISLTLSFCFLNKTTSNLRLFMTNTITLYIFFHSYV